MRNHHIINCWPSLELELENILAIVGVNIPWYCPGPIVQPPTVTPTPVQCVTIALSIARPRWVITWSQIEFSSEILWLPSKFPPWQIPTMVGICPRWLWWDFVTWQIPTIDDDDEELQDEDFFGILLPFLTQISELWKSNKKYVPSLSWSQVYFQLFNHLTNEDEDEDDDSYVVKFNQPLKLSSEERYLVIKFIWWSKWY